jgi:hypothetical protein
MLNILLPSFLGPKNQNFALKKKSLINAGTSQLIRTLFRIYFNQPSEIFHVEYTQRSPEYYRKKVLDSLANYGEDFLKEIRSWEKSVTSYVWKNLHDYEKNAETVYSGDIPVRTFLIMPSFKGGFDNSEDLPSSTEVPRGITLAAYCLAYIDSLEGSKKSLEQLEGDVGRMMKNSGGSEAQRRHLISWYREFRSEDGKYHDLLFPEAMAAYLPEPNSISLKRIYWAHLPAFEEGGEKRMKPLEDLLMNRKPFDRRSGENVVNDEKKFYSFLTHELTHFYIHQKSEVYDYEDEHLKALNEGAAFATEYAYGFSHTHVDGYRTDTKKSLLESSIHAFLESTKGLRASERIDQIRQKAVKVMQKSVEENRDPIKLIHGGQLSGTQTEVIKEYDRAVEKAQYYMIHSLEIMDVIDVPKSEEWMKELDDEKGRKNLEEDESREVREELFQEDLEEIHRRSEKVLEKLEKRNDRSAQDKFREFHEEIEKITEEYSQTQELYKAIEEIDEESLNRKHVERRAKILQKRDETDEKEEICRELLESLETHIKWAKEIGKRFQQLEKTLGKIHDDEKELSRKLEEIDDSNVDQLLDSTEEAYQICQEGLQDLLEATDILKKAKQEVKKIQ